VDEQRWVALEPEAIDAVCFDLDGVVTSTQHLHAVAWKETFDALLRDRAGPGEGFEPFDAETDYVEHVDGKPRLAGVRAFLAARGIQLPEGNPGDEPGLDTVHALAERKNRRFQALLRDEEPDVYEDAVDLVDRLETAGIRCGLFSASRNAREVLRRAGLANRFETVVDGVLAAEEGLAGKPDPQTLVETARRLDAEPRSAAVLEDAEPGVEAGRRGGFALVVGVDRVGHAEALAEHGADAVVSTLSDVLVPTNDPDELPSALDGELFDELQAHPPVVFLDFDGTLSPIVDEPDEARIADGMREAVGRLAEGCPVAIVTGRDVDDVIERVGLFDLYYAGSHGFEIHRPDGTRLRMAVPEEQTASLDRARTELGSALADVPGARLEPKQVSVAVHDRQVPDADRSTVHEAVDEVRRRYPELRVAPGKHVHEIRPDVDWHKGKALEVLLDELAIDPDRTPVVYVGDDVTDEDAFRTLPEAVRVLVRGEHQRTHADRALADPDEVRAWIHELADRLEEAPP